MRALSFNTAAATAKSQLLAIGDDEGVLRVAEVPSTLRRPMPGEHARMARFFEAQTHKVADTESRQVRPRYPHTPTLAQCLASGLAWPRTADNEQGSPAGVCRRAVHERVSSQGQLTRCPCELTTSRRSRSCGLLWRGAAVGAPGEGLQTCMTFTRCGAGWLLCEPVPLCGAGVGSAPWLGRSCDAVA